MEVEHRGEKSNTASRGCGKTKRGHHKLIITDPVLGEPRFLSGTVVRERPGTRPVRTTLADCTNSLIGKQLVRKPRLAESSQFWFGFVIRCNKLCNKPETRPA